MEYNEQAIETIDDAGCVIANKNIEIEQLRQRVAQLEKIVAKQQFIEERYEELMLSARRCWRYYGVDKELFNASIKTMDFLIRRHATEIDEMEENDNV